MPDLPFELNAPDVKRRLDTEQPVALIDVREPFEHQTASIAGAHLFPMNTIPARLQEIEAISDEMPLIVFCHHGVRSLNVVSWLRQRGIENCQSMAGGIDAWSLQVDRSVPRY